MVKYGSTDRCVVCNKLVGFAEAVYHDDKVYHQNHYRCESCNKKLARGLGLTKGGKMYCHNCHRKAGKAFNPKIKNIERKRETLRKVVAPRQPAFAHRATIKRSKKDAPKPYSEKTRKQKTVLDAGKRLHEFEVAIFNGSSVDELKTYLELGDVDVSTWNKKTFESLLLEIKEGRSELGYDADGRALRVASVVKVFIQDVFNGLLLLNPLNSEGSVKATPGNKAGNRKHLAETQFENNIYPGVVDFMDFNFGVDFSATGDVSENAYAGLFEYLGFAKPSSGRNSVKIKAGSSMFEVPGAIIPETTFTLNETAQQAAARLFGTRIGQGNVSPRMFSKQVHKVVKTHLSKSFKNLNSEYHIYNVTMKTQLITGLQKKLPIGKAASFDLGSGAKTTRWYIWAKEGDDIGTVVDMLNSSGLSGFEREFISSHFDEVAKAEFAIAKRWKN
eukprot:snap_masked-scaffold_33-processed-gene-3.11-mRNA-1 protein AED:1.00 eAED:1.00 QI:0/-1/0/0/-1/1/1/0/444